MPAYWLFKTEPKTYAYEDLERDGRTRWDGVRNAVAQKHLAAVRRGDLVFVYHTGDVKALVGVARAVSDPAPDPAEPSLATVEIEAVRRLRRPVTLMEVKSNPAFAGFDLVRLPRLSVMPVDDERARELERMAAAEP